LERTAYIDVRGLHVGTGKAHRFPIEELYIPLTTSAAPQERLREARRRPLGDDLEARGATRIELHEALASPRLAIVADPGAGKTTFLDRIAHALAKARLGRVPEEDQKRSGPVQGRFPLLIRAADLAAHVAEARRRNVGPMGERAPAWLAHYLATASKESGVELPEAFFLDELAGGAALVLLDGLDEVPTETERQWMAGLV